MISWLMIVLVRVYQLTLSPLLAFIAGPGGGCRFHPTCSHYFIEAVRKHGAVHGGWLGLKRIARCHPWTPAGHDPVPEPQQKSGQNKLNL